MKRYTAILALLICGLTLGQTGAKKRPAKLTGLGIDLRPAQEIHQDTEHIRLLLGRVAGGGGYQKTTALRLPVDTNGGQLVTEQGETVYGGMDVVGGTRAYQLRTVDRFVRALRRNPDWFLRFATRAPCKFVLLSSEVYRSEPVFMTTDRKKNRRLYRQAVRALLVSWHYRKGELQ